MHAGGETALVTTSDTGPYRALLGGIAEHRIEAADLEEDARTTQALAARLGAAWVAADGYQFDAAWQRAFAGATRLLFFDDYGHGAPHSADVVLNQNPSATLQQYAARDRKTRLLLGLRFATLRAQFAAWRGWERSTPARAQRLLVTFGGTDPARVTFKAIEALRDDTTLSVEIIVGAGNPFCSEIERACAGTHLRVRRDVTDMPALMAECDFALAAAGSTTLECVFLGLPLNVFAVADNQRELARALAACGVARDLGWHSEIAPEAIAEAVAQLREDGAARAAMSAAGRALVDGHGAARVVAHLRAALLDLRPATGDDAQLLFDWANDAGTRAASLSSAPIPWETHIAWLGRRLIDGTSVLWIGSDAEGPAGIVRFQIDGADATISLTIAEARRGAGFGAALILRGCHRLLRERPVANIRAVIKPENHASLSAFRHAGFRAEPGDDACAHLIFSRHDVPESELL